MGYTREQVYEETIKYFKGDDLATTVWIDKYCLKHKGVYYEKSPRDMHKRLAKELARIEAKYPNPMSEKEIFDLLDNFKYIIPQGSPMAGIGNIFAISSISNCLVIGNSVDSYGGIMKADEEQAQLMKRRCGVGQDISFIRPSGAYAGASPLGPNAGTTLYMERFSNTTREVQQDGRRGALMLSISVNHPDAEKFIDKKTTPGSVTGANVSVKITRKFMDALNAGEMFYQTFPVEHSIEDVTGTLTYDSLEMEEDKLYVGEKINGKQTYYKKVDPKKIYGKIVLNAWSSAEPGIIFEDQIHEESPARGYGDGWLETSTNPCGEIPMPPYDSCRLLVINLFGYMYKGFTPEAMLEDQLLVDHVGKAMRLMDNIVDLELEKVEAILEDIKSKTYPEEFQRVEKALWSKIYARGVQGRRTGLGITAEGDLIAGLGLTYGTKEATEFSDKLHELIATTAYAASFELAKERGPFPIFEREKERSVFLQRILNSPALPSGARETYEEYGRRNIGVLTIAPTGSVSLLAQVSSGIEPVFSIVHFRKKKVPVGEPFDWTDENGDNWLEYPVFHKPFYDWYAANNNVDFEGAREILNKKSKEEIEELVKQSPWNGATSRDVDYVEKVRMQGAVQKWVDHSISVTVNMPESVTVEMVGAVYQQAYESGCKGITVYRDNSRGNVLSTESIKKVEDKKEFDYLAGVKRPKEVECDIYFKSHMKNPFIILVGLIEDKPYEVFAVPYSESTKFSKTFKKGTIVKLGGGKYTLIDNDMGVTLIEDITSHMIETEQNSTRLISALLRHRMEPKHLSKILRKFTTITGFHKVIEKVLNGYLSEEDLEGDCPACEGKMQMTEGCMKCPECGYAACG